MTEHEGQHDDFLDGMLGADSAPRSGDALRAAVLAQTVGVIRFRRRMKKGILAAALAGCYLAGMATATLWRPVADRSIPSPAPTIVAVTEPGLAETAAPEPTINKPAEQPPMARSAVPSSRSSSASNRPVGVPRKNRVQTIREKADRHLLEQGDVASAVRDYTCALNLAPANQRAIRPEQDSWLLMALKDSKIKEIRRERAFVD